MDSKWEPLFLKPAFQSYIWGGTALRDVFGYEFPSATAAECWGISAHPHGMSVVENGIYAGWSLASLWEEHRELFGGLDGEKFPLLVKILDAADDLSVQVHPSDEQAPAGELGKTECWYVIDCVPGAELVLGHHAESRAEAEAMIARGDWDGLLRRVPIQRGDFIYLPSGLVHAIGKGALILETQQNSDTTYRLYDYNRVDADGKRRELHLEKSLDVMKFPFEPVDSDVMEFELDDTTVSSFVSNNYFSVYKWEIRSEATFVQDQAFMNLSVIRGFGELIHDGRSYALKAGTHLVLPFEFGEFTLRGNLEIIISHV